MSSMESKATKHFTSEFGSWRTQREQADTHHWPLNGATLFGTIFIRTTEHVNSFNGRGANQLELMGRARKQTNENWCSRTPYLLFWAPGRTLMQTATAMKYHTLPRSQSEQNSWKPTCKRWYNLFDLPLSCALSKGYFPTTIAYKKTPQDHMSDICGSRIPCLVSHLQCSEL